LFKNAINNIQLQQADSEVSRGEG